MGHVGNPRLFRLTNPKKGKSLPTIIGQLSSKLREWSIPVKSSRTSNIRLKKSYKTHLAFNKSKSFFKKYFLKIKKPFFLAHPSWAQLWYANDPGKFSESAVSFLRYSKFFASKGGLSSFRQKRRYLRTVNSAFSGYFSNLVFLQKPNGYTIFKPLYISRLLRKFIRKKGSPFPFDFKNEKFGRFYRFRNLAYSSSIVPQPKVISVDNLKLRRFEGRKFIRKANLFFKHDYFSYRMLEEGKLPAKQGPYFDEKTGTLAELDGFLKRFGNELKKANLPDDPDDEGEIDSIRAGKTTYYFYPDLRSLSKISTTIRQLKTELLEYPSYINQKSLREKNKAPFLNEKIYTTYLNLTERFFVAKQPSLNVPYSQKISHKLHKSLEKFYSHKKKLYNADFQNTFFLVFGILLYFEVVSLYRKASRPRNEESYSNDFKISKCISRTKEDYIYQATLEDRILGLQEHLPLTAQTTIKELEDMVKENLLSLKEKRAISIDKKKGKEKTPRRIRRV